DLEERDARVVRGAMSFRGTPYRMGAEGRGAFDCSSFVRHIFAKEGKYLPRTAAEQYNCGRPVDKADLKPGDVVFFKNTYKRGVSHVGIYMGDGKFIHASSRGGVKESNLNDSYYINHWAGARRPNVTQGFD
ncbi:MAG: C40 family peptidase, partial [Fibrella sp.]|nr:C40 family peptidase [Armatimonadota bacterium]